MEHEQIVQKAQLGDAEAQLKLGTFYAVRGIRKEFSLYEWSELESDEINKNFTL